MTISSRPTLVPLDPDHPGFRDLAYRSRRDAIAEAALAHRPGTVPPRIEFAPEEHAVWRTVWERLSPLHDEYACAEFKASLQRLAFDRSEIPQLVDVNARLEALAGPGGQPVTLVPVAGLVSSRAFLGHLATGQFLATQYIRHHSVPLYTPEPDIVHELVGHAASFAHQDFVTLNSAFGRAAQRSDDSTIQKLAYLYWYTMEFGVVYEEGAPKAYGAGLLSSYGELARIEEIPLRSLDCDEAAATSYDPTCYQPVLFAAASFDQLKADLLSWLENYP